MQITLLGSEEGLFAYSPTCGHTGPVLVRFGGLDNVYQLTYVPGLHQVLLITGVQFKLQFRVFVFLVFFLFLLYLPSQSTVMYYEFAFKNHLNFLPTA